MLQLLLAFLLILSPAHAQDEAPEPAPSGFDAIDAAFAEWVVGPMAGVMFWDIAFWDDELAEGDGIGDLVGEERVVDWSGDEGYTFQALVPVTADQVTPLPTGEVTLEAQGITWYLFRDEGQNLGSVLAQDVPIPDGTELAEDGSFVLEGVLPFPVTVQAKDLEDLSLGGTIVESRDNPVRDISGMVPPVAVNHLVLHQGIERQIDSLGEAGAMVLRGETRLEKTQLANPENMSLPAVVVWLVMGAVFFTLRMGFINLRGLAHAVAVTRGVYDNPDDPGEISHFQALSSALSATVGLGNIAGVAVAVGLGGPGAIFWMVVAGFLGMSSKFAECTLGQMYRVVDPDTKRVSGGPMRYLSAGLKELGLGGLGKVLAGIFALMCIGGSLGGGNMFQANQSYAAVAEVVPLFEGRAWLYGILLAGFVGLVIIGGIRSIGKVAGVIVPVMCGVYVLAAMVVLFSHAADVPAAFGTIIGEAFTPEAGRGGLVGVLIIGFQRAAFSNEAGVGSASIAHSAAATDEPVREGIVALLEPFIDTIIVCTMTGLVVVITGTYKTHAGEGVLMTSEAFASVLPWFPLILSFAVVMFAFSTMISWSYYGERCWSYLFGENAVVGMIYKVIFLAACFFGAVFNLGSVLDFSDLMILGMAFPNILGVALLSGKVKKALDAYWGKLKSGKFAERA
jgi:AGCS family alanine or glycine:cation symporter